MQQMADRIDSFAVYFPLEFMVRHELYTNLEPDIIDYKIAAKSLLGWLVLDVLLAIICVMFRQSFHFVLYLKKKF